MAPSSRILSLHVFVLLLSALEPGARAAAVYGVNLGGWLVAEPWMTPSLFEPSKSDCEWTLCTNLGKDKCRDTLEDHWKTFITRDDVEQIKNAGLTSIRIPLGYWAVIDLLPFEPYVSGQYQYLKQAVGWAKDLGLKVFIDLHGAPGSQNGWEESGYVGKQLFSANQSNADRTLQVIKNLTKEFSQSEYEGTVTNIEVLNEPTLDFAPLQKFYTQAAGVNATGINITLSDGFFQPHSWKNYDPWNAAATKPAPLLTLDTHQFWAFPPLDNLSEAQILTQVCELGMQLKVPNSGLMPTLIGEWSLSTGVTANSTSNTEQDQKKRTWFRRLFEAQHAAFSPNGEDQASVGWYFWSWKTEYDIDAWSYRKGLADGYIPSNISDPTKLIFPIKPNGCIDDTFAYTAAATVTPSPTPSGTTSDSSSASPSSSSKSTATRNDMIPVLLLSVQLLAGSAGFLYLYA